MHTNFPDEARQIAAKAATKVTGDYYGPDDVYVVWFCYILGGWKALVSTPVEDGRYYEVTHNHEKNENYVYVYKRENDPGVHGCSNHIPMQHRDGKEPWCDNCKRNENGDIPSGLF